MGCKKMTRFPKLITPWFVVLGLSIWLGFEVAVLLADHAGITRVRQDLAGLENVRDINRALQKRRWQYEELLQLRQGNRELNRLSAELQRLKEIGDGRGVVLDEAAQLQKLRRDNQWIREENLQLEQAPETLQAEQTLDANQLKQIAKAFRLYAEVNSGRLPGNLSELKFYTPADVFQSLQTSRFEILVAGGMADIAEPAKTPLLRSKSADRQNLRAYLFADGHLELKREE
ncbi:MAG: hypothetical protein JWR26_98 [Pedosphaera sp.]|nr:hypothetical protein [Pedosphaera sp.]